MELTAIQWLLVAFSAVVGGLSGVWVARKVKEYEGGTLAQILSGGLVFIGITLIVSGLTVAPIGEMLGLRTKEAPTVQYPPPSPELQNVGYVFALVTDKYAYPETYIENASVGVSLQAPTPGGLFVPVAEGTTGANGTVLLQVSGLTSGQVYVMAQKSGYYSDVTSTVIPGAQVYPPESLWAKIKLARIGSLQIDVENRAGNTYNAVTKQITENLTTAKTQEFIIEFSVPEVYTCVRNLQVVFIRGSDWATLQASPIVVSVVESGGLSVNTTGDISLNRDVSAYMTFSGDLTSEKTIKIKIRTSTATADTGELLRIVVNDLNGGVGYAGETGIPAVQMKVLTVV